MSEDNVYLPASKRFIESFVSEAPNYPEVQEILDAYRKRFSIDLFHEYLSGGAVVVDGDKRVFEAGIYAAAAVFLERRWLKSSPSCIGFYSSGIAPALVYSGVVSMAEYLENILPFHVANRRAYAETGKQQRLAQVRLESDVKEDLEGSIQEILDKNDLGERVFFKDRRHRHTSLIAGDESGVWIVYNGVREQLTSVAARSKAPVPVPAAHLPLYDRAPLLRMLENVKLAPPKHCLIGIAGEVVPQRTTDYEILRQLIVSAATDPLNTGRAVRAAAKCATRIVVIGSSFGAAVLRRTELGGYPKAELGTDLAITCEQVVGD